jgi:hypothetical protein
MERGQSEVDLAPFKAANLGGTQAMPVGDQDHGGVPVTVAVVLRGLDYPLDLGRGEVFAHPQLGVLRPAWGNCSVFEGRCDEPQLRFHWHFGPPVVQFTSS